MVSDFTTGDRIKHARRLAGLTQKELAEMLGVLPSMIGQYETGARKPKLDTVQKLARSLNVSTDYLLGESDQYSNLQKDVYDAIFGKKEIQGGQSLVNAVVGLIPILSDLDAISDDGHASLNDAIRCISAVIDGLGDLFLLCADEKKRIAADIPSSRSTTFIHDAINIKSVIAEPISDYFFCVEEELEALKSGKE